MIRLSDENAKRVWRALQTFGAALFNLNIDDLETPGTVFQIGLVPSHIDVILLGKTKMDIIWEELSAGLPDSRQLIHVIIRLIAAAVLGAIIGLQREKIGKPAGLRTHMLVTLGSCVFILACSGYGMDADALSRVIQGIVTGIGFIGAGSILKLNEERDIQGLTTSAGIWMTAAIGVAVGLGTLGLAILATIVTYIILVFAGRIEFQIDKKRNKNSADTED